MSTSTIPQLQETTEPTDEYVLPVDSGVQTYKVTMANLIARIKESLGDTSTVGTIKIWTETNAPTKYVKLNGQTELISTYPELFALYGTKYGGDGVTTFGVPDFRGRVAGGVDEGIGRLTGLTLGTATGNENVISGQTSVSWDSATVNTSGGAATFNKNVMNSNQNAHSHGAGTYYAKITGQTSTDDIHMQRDTSLPETWDATHATTDINFGGGTPVAGHGSGVDVGGTSSTSSVSWDSATVNTSFTNPSFDKTEMNSNQNAHGHTVSTVQPTLGVYFIVKALP